MAAGRNYARGSEWRRWDLHVHTPASQLGTSFTGVSWPDYVTALEAAAKKHNVAVIGVTDYMTIDGYETLLEMQQNPADPRLSSVMLLPNIEFRCSPQTKEGAALNIHLLINVGEDDHVAKIKNSLRNLRVTYKGQTYGCIKDDLIRFAQAQSPTLNGDAAYKFGIQQFKPPYTDIFDWLDSDAWLKANSIVGIANGKDGISGLPLDAFAATRDELLCRAHFVFSGNPADRTHYLGLKNGCPPSEIIRQYNSLKPCFHGCDAHALEKLFEPDQKRFFWVKADPTFNGLLQCIREPSKRTYIGECPEKLAEIAENKTFFIDTVTVEKTPGTLSTGTWLDGCRLPLNPDLVAIIGNKGSGKSALADVIALLGNSRQKAHFSFLKKDRFRGKSGEPAKHFLGTLTWCDASEEKRNLNDDPPPDKVELVRYIPQGHFEELCNEHVAGRSNAFERELRTVIFSHAGDSIRLGALNFEQLIEQQERSFRDQLGEFRKDLKKINDDISSIEDQLQPDIKKALKEEHALKVRQIDEHNKIKPKVEEKPDGELNPEQKAVAAALDSISIKLKELEQRTLAASASDALFSKKLKAAQNVRERLRLLERAHKQFQDDSATDLETLGLKDSEIATLSLNIKPVEEIVSATQAEQENLKLSRSKDVEEKAKLVAEQNNLKTKLNAPQLIYQQSLKAYEEWAAKLEELIGTPAAPETLKGLEARIAQLDNLPTTLGERREQRFKLAGEIFDILDAQRKARELLFQPVQDLIQGNSLIREEYKLQFQASLGGSPEVVAESLFAIIKQNSGEFRGIDESFAAVKRIAEAYDFNSREGVLGFITDLNNRVENAASGGDKSSVGIANILKKDRAASDVYDLLFGLSFLEPRYSLLFQDAQIEQLSPGQRGALLLIFYLLVDKGRNPIILDQPEENLDNETVVSLLVPVLTEAKKRRQIIMVTHNPNLAVVCDAEQVIYSCFDRKSGSAISYQPGSIESPQINSHVVNVLEGTKPAFDNRRVKYH